MPVARTEGQKQSHFLRRLCRFTFAQCGDLPQILCDNMTSKNQSTSGARKRVNIVDRAVCHTRSCMASSPDNFTATTYSHLRKNRVRPEWRPRPDRREGKGRKLLLPWIALTVVGDAAHEYIRHSVFCVARHYCASHVDTVNVQCTMYNVQCTMYNVQCTMYSVQCTMYNVQCTMYNVQCTMYKVQCIVYSV